MFGSPDCAGFRGSSSIAPPLLSRTQELYSGARFANCRRNPSLIAYYTRSGQQLSVGDCQSRSFYWRSPACGTHHSYRKPRRKLLSTLETICFWFACFAFRH